MLPKRDIKHNHSSTSSFDKGRQLKSTVKVKKQSNSLKRKSMATTIFVAAIALVFVLVVVFSIYSYIGVKKFNTSLEKSFIQLGSTCKNYETSKPLNSLLLVSIDSSKNLKNVDYLIYDSEKIIKVNFNDVEFDVDKVGTKGNLKKYVDLNNIYLDDDKIFSNLTNLFLREFYLKVDHVIVSNDVFNLKDYIARNDSAFFLKLKNSNINQYHEIKTDICPATLADFTKDYSNENRSEKDAGYSDGFKIADYFYFGDIRKEQIRIHLNNRTGVETWGIFFTNLLENYGLNVVKLDTSSDLLLNSQIYIDDDSLRDSGTVKQILYLVDNLSPKAGLDKKNSIYSDVYIDIGQDWLIK